LLQRFGQLILNSHFTPEYPGSHIHYPNPQTPLPEQESHCYNSLQVNPEKPSKQIHFPLMHLP